MKRKHLLVRNQSRGSSLPRVAALLLVAFLSCVGTKAFAYDFTAENGDGVTIYYNYINDRTEAEVTYKAWGDSGYSGDVTIPATVTSDGTTLNVTSIGAYALRYCPMTTVTIGDNVTSIGSDAFTRCTSLISVIIGKSVTSIGDYAFDGCTSLTEVTIPDNVTSIGGNAFRDCTSLTSVTIGNGVTSIGSNAFDRCKGLTSVTIGKSVTSIGSYAFQYCTNLAKVILLGSSLPNCGTNIFNGVDLTDATLYCAPGLETYCSETAPWSSFGSIYTLVTLADGERLSKYITDDNKDTVTKLKIYGEINSDDISLMADMTKNGALSVIDMSEATAATANLIGDNVFLNCGKLTSISLPKGVTSVGYHAFSYCTSLVSIDFPDALTSIGDQSFYGCSALTSVVIPDNVTIVYSMAFKDCSSLTSVTVGKSVTKMETYAFYNCEKLEKVIVKDIAAWCGMDFYEYTCNPLYYAKHLYNEDGVEIKDLVIPDGVTSIAQYTFCKCSNLTSITIPQSVTSIAKSAFDNCSGLTSATIGSGVTSIGERAFYGCSALTSVAIPDKVTSIGNMAFSDCTGLTSVSLPESLTTIGAAAFSSCKGLTTVNIPNSVTSIGLSAFQECSNLTTVNIPNSVTSIGSSAFSYCKGLTSVNIPSSVTNIGYRTFYECTSLTSITIPANVTSIGEEAFRVCYNLKEVTLQGKALPTARYTNFFNDINLSNATLYCKAALVEKCKETDPWKNFGTITPKPFSIAITDAGIATGCFDDDLDFSGVTGVKAYIASGFNPETGKVLMTNVTEVPAGTGFLVKGEANTYEIPAAATKYVYVNMLVGTLEETILATTADSYTNYVLDKGSDGVVSFCKANETVVPANKAYLRIPTSAVTTGETSEAKTSLQLSFDDEESTTGITTVTNAEEETNGNTIIYNLNGQRKQSLTKGLNIVNGKKIFVK